ncbi:hypothetical protein WJU16_25595 [Chitinophaga pollutisoli]|uniref:FtsX-like permease family protein n=1 Tax=Chitinophaga pollutisoli TaxID=3133966 RepID=A0ABZ2YPA8_9BACT
MVRNYIKVATGRLRQLMLLLSREFLVQICNVAVIAIPVAWYGLHQWLNGYPYSMDLSWWVFALAGTFTLAMALLTVSFHSLKAAFTNLIKSLQSE